MTSSLLPPTPVPHRLPGVLHPRASLRVEGVALLAGAVVLYALTDASWWFFGLLFFVPDLGLLGYLAGTRTGAITYNLSHGLAIPIALGLAGHLVAESPALAPLTLVWIAHIGFDRALGYGLKYATDFHDTHLHRVA